MKHTILVVDDEIDNVDALERLFRRKYNVLKALSADEGLALLKENKVSLIISDQRMPKKTGVEFLKESQKYAPEAVRMLLTGYTDIESVIDAINSGEVYRYITKPWDPVDLANTVDKGIERYELSAELKEKNAALSAALAELRTLDEAKSNFMILINHELKTPLTVVLSFLELLKETSLSAEQSKYIDRIWTGSGKLKKIIDDVLTFVSAETGLLKVSKKKVSTNQMISDLATKHRGATEAKKQRIVLPKNDFQIKADHKIVSDAVERLIENAIRFGTADSIIEIETQEQSDGRVEIAVTNEGKAIPAKTLEKIMKPFTLDEDVLKHSEGLGLGLSLTQALLKTHDSKLVLECPKGKIKASFLI
jgi:two-component system, sensor histidine kinase and response regulator